MKRILLAAAGALALASPAAAQTRDTTIKLDAIVAVVGNVPITAYDVERRLGDSLAAFMRRGAGMQTKPVQAAMVNSALNDLVDEEVLLIKAKEAGIEISDAEAAGAIENMMKQVTSQYPSQAAFRQALAEAGYGTPEDYRRFMTVQYKRVFPMGKLFGWSTDQVVKASTVLRNQPYGDQATPVYAKCT